MNNTDCVSPMFEWIYFTINKTWTHSQYTISNKISCISAWLHCCDRLFLSSLTLEQSLAEWPFSRYGTLWNYFLRSKKTNLFPLLFLPSDPLHVIFMLRTICLKNLIFNIKNLRTENVSINHSPFLNIHRIIDLCTPSHN